MRQRMRLLCYCILFGRMLLFVKGLVNSQVSRDNELFAVAPMMSHTHRHYRYFFRQLSQDAHLYTEMLPSSQIVQVLERVAGKGSIESPQQIQETVNRLREQPKWNEWSLDWKSYNLLQELFEGGRNGCGPVAIQLGGRDPEILGKAAAIATAFGYTSVNLNCGCPSSSVASGRQAGAALMKEPELVAQCLEKMSYSMDTINPKAILSVKHRLGVASADTYDAAYDHEQNDEEAYKSCSNFCKIVGMAGKVSTLHVHARLALLGLGETQSLKNPSTKTRDDVKMNHKRMLYFKKQKARKATIDNRSVPPLRPGVVEQIARDFPNLKILSNGQISSIADIQDRTIGKVSGVMVGRAAINHPCSFAGVDSVLWKNPNSKPSRSTVLMNYMDYCQTVEEEFKTHFFASSEDDRKDFRKKLVSSPFHLLMGEDGNEKYQRTLRKLCSRGDRYSAQAIIQAAMTHVPVETLSKRVDNHTPWKEIQTYDSTTKRSGALQRIIY